MTGTKFDLEIFMEEYFALLTVLREITKETIAAGIWKKLETLYMTYISNIRLSWHIVIKVVMNEDQVSGSGADGYDSADVMMAMGDEELLDLIMDSGGLTPYNIHERLLG
ncbi:hypothetical protein Tco_0167709 [Tanacetum coccineum]